MHKHLIITLLLLLTCQAATLAQNSYNFNRGLEEFDNGNYEAAMRHFVQELQQVEEDPGSWFYIAAIYERTHQLGHALTTVNTCIKNATETKEKETLAMAYHLRSYIYRQLGDTIAELNDLNQAVKVAPKDVLDVMLKLRGDYYYSHNNYALSDADYSKVLSIKEQNANAMIGLARNAVAGKQFNKAIEWSTRALNTDPDKTVAALAYRCDGYMGLKDYGRAVDDLIGAIEDAGDNIDDIVLDRIVTLSDSAFTPLAERLKQKVATNPENDVWISALGLAAVHAGHQSEALAMLETAAEGGDDSFINGMLARCLNDLGQYDRAVALKRQSIERDSTNLTDYYGLAGMLKNAGRLDEALTTIDTYLEKEPDDSDGYSLRATIHQYARRPEQAIDDYTTAIVLSEPDGDSAKERYARGILLEAQGHQAEARADWQNVVDTDSTSLVAALANQRLGNTSKAQQIIDSFINKDESPADRRRTLLHAACLQALRGDNPQAIQLLQQACQSLSIPPTILLNDPDLAGLKGNPGFEQIVESQNILNTNSTATH